MTFAGPAGRMTFAGPAGRMTFAGPAGRMTFAGPAGWMTFAGLAGQRYHQKMTLLLAWVEMGCKRRAGGWCCHSTELQRV